MVSKKDYIVSISPIPYPTLHSEVIVFYKNGELKGIIKSNLQKVLNDYTKGNTYSNSYFYLVAKNKIIREIVQQNLNKQLNLFK